MFVPTRSNTISSGLRLKLALELGLALGASVSFRVRRLGGLGLGLVLRLGFGDKVKKNVLIGTELCVPTRLAIQDSVCVCVCISSHLNRRW